MKFKHLFALYSLFFITAQSSANAADAGLRFINSRGEIRCGTDLSAPAYAAKTEDGKWKGFDADICRAMSYAVFGRGDRFSMVDVKADNVSKALKTGKIDFMLGGLANSAKADSTSSYSPAVLLYYDQQAFLARNAQKTKSMEDFKNATVCVVADSPELNNLEEYNNKYGLNLKPLTFSSKNAALQSFLLNRCRLLTGNIIFLSGVKETHFGDYDDEESGIKLLPEPVALVPVYLYASNENLKLQMIARWVVNALQLSDVYGVNYHNAAVKVGLRNTSQRNLLGEDPKLWLSFGLTPDWVKKALADVGNYSEIYDRSFGRFSPLKLEREENNYLKDGGLINPAPFL